MVTDAQMLDAVRQALRAVAVAGQEYRLPDGRVVKQANLSDLRAMQRELEGRLGVAAPAGAAPIFTPVAWRRAT